MQRAEEGETEGGPGEGAQELVTQQIFLSPVRGVSESGRTGTGKEGEQKLETRVHLPDACREDAGSPEGPAAGSRS